MEVRSLHAMAYCMPAVVRTSGLEEAPERSSAGRAVLLLGTSQNRSRTVRTPTHMMENCTRSSKNMAPAGADRGLLKEFEAIIAVVIGGALLTGGYGSVIGAALGALIFGVVQQGLFFANVESSLFRVFLGVILLLAVILNTC